MNRKQRKRLKRLQGKNGGKKEANPYFVATGGFGVDLGQKSAFANEPCASLGFEIWRVKGGDCYAEKTK